jgi:hypothetical protein
MSVMADRGAIATDAHIDHVAIQVPSIESAVELFTEILGMKLKRTGTRHATGGRFVLLGDDHGMKLELVQEPDATLALLHLAYRVTDVAAAYERLLERGCTSVRMPLWLDTAKAEFAMVRHPSGFEVCGGSVGLDRKTGFVKC